MNNMAVDSVSIDKKINTAELRSSIISSKKLTWQEKVDNLLDRMNELNALLLDIHTIILSLTIDIEKDFSGFKKSKIAIDALTKINKHASKILMVVRKSDLFPGVKTSYYLIKSENKYLRELLVDRKIGIELDLDEEINQIMDETVVLANKNLKEK